MEQICFKMILFVHVVDRYSLSVYYVTGRRLLRYTDTQYAPSIFFMGINPNDDDPEEIRAP